MFQNIIHNMFKCPGCNETINYLDYDIPISGNEWGSCSLRKDQSGQIITEDFEYSDSSYDLDGSYEYKCPECSNDLNLNDLIEIDPEELADREEKENKTEDYGEENPRAQTKSTEDKALFTHKFREDLITQATGICPKCKYIFLKEIDIRAFNTEEQKNQTCPNCYLEYKI